MSDRCHCPNEHWQNYPEGGTCGVCGKPLGTPLLDTTPPFLTEPLRLHDSHVVVAREELEGLRADRERLELLLNNSYYVKRFRAIGRMKYAVFSDPEHIIATGMTRREAIDAARGAQ